MLVDYGSKKKGSPAEFVFIEKPNLPKLFSLEEV